MHTINSLLISYLNLKYFLTSKNYRKNAAGLLEPINLKIKSTSYQNNEYANFSAKQLVLFSFNY